MSEPTQSDDTRLHPISRRFLFTESKAFRNGVNIALAVLALGLALADFVIHRHGYFEFEEKTPTFYALYGFIAFSFVVLMGKPLRRLLGRREDYYDDGGRDD